MKEKEKELTSGMINTLTWRRTDWKGRNFMLSIGKEIIGRLTFDSTWNFDAVYADHEINLRFTRKNFWDRTVVIARDGKTIGEVHSGLFGEQRLKLATGERFYLSTSFWEQEVYWKTEKGETIVKYQQASMSSMQKGLISTSQALTIEEKKILTSCGLYVRQLVRKRKARIIAVLIPIVIAGSRF